MDDVLCFVYTHAYFILCTERHAFPYHQQLWNTKLHIFLTYKGLYLFFTFSKHRTVWCGEVASWFIVRWYCSCLTCLLCPKPHTYACYLQYGFCTGI